MPAGSVKSKGDWSKLGQWVAAKIWDPRLLLHDWRAEAVHDVISDQMSQPRFVGMIWI